MSWTPIQGNQSSKGLLDAENSSVVITYGAGVAAGAPDLDGGIKPGATPDASNIYEGNRGKSINPGSGLTNVATNTLGPIE
jgi:hypothetical protein